MLFVPAMNARGVHRLTNRARADEAFKDKKTQEIWERTRALLLDMQQKPDSWEVRLGLFAMCRNDEIGR
jgi:hypothetical protein